MKEFFKALESLAEKCVVKALKVDLISGKYKILYIDKGENKSVSPLLNDWVEESCRKELIHPDYAEACIHIINVEHFKSIFKYKKYIHLKIKRMPFLNGEYRNSVITVLPDDENHVYLIVYDIDEE